MEIWHWWEIAQTAIIIIVGIICYSTTGDMNITTTEVVEKEITEEDLDELIKRIRDKQL
jgi:hypothetical protein